MTRRFTARLLLFLVLLCAPAATHAQETNLEKAKTTYENAFEAFKKGSYEKAADLFRESYELSGKPELLYNEAVAHWKGGDLESARRVAAEALASDELPAPVRTRTLARIRVWNVIDCSEAVGGALAQRLVAEEAAAAEELRPVTPPADEPGNGLRIASYIVGGLGIGALGLFTAMEVMLMSEADELDGAVARRDPVAYRSSLDRAQGLQRVGQVALVSGATLLVAGVVMWILSMPDEVETEPGVVLRF